ncbi:MAG: hypothetical protein RR034_05975 [Bacteroidales bacterium]
MASFLNLYNEIEYKIKQASLRLNERVGENLKLKEENDRIKAENEQLRLRIGTLEEKLKLITITKTVLNKEDKKETKKKISDLVREIDNCIGLLNR